MTNSDGFIDPAHNIIYNRLGLTDAGRLQQAEADYSIPAMLRLVLGIIEIPGQFDAAHLKHIHREVFQDVYGWAGQTRANGPNGPFQGQKPSYARSPQGDTMRYAPYAQLDQRLDAIAAQLNQENNLRGLSEAQFAERAAYYFDQYNHAHAFREGNGRTIQSLLAILGRQAGYEVELGSAAAPRLNQARDLAIIRPHGPAQPARNLEPLVQLLRSAIAPIAGTAAAQLRVSGLARPLAASTPAMQRMEAQRVMQSSAFTIGAALRDIDRGDPTRGNHFLQLTSQLLHGPATAGQLAPAIQLLVQEVAQEPRLQQEPATMQHASWLAGSIEQLVELEQPLPAQQPTPQAPTKTKATAAASKKAPPPKRQSSKL